jgi:hypothetical protein
MSDPLSDNAKFYSAPTAAEYDEAYQEILVIYDIAEELADTPNHPLARFQDEQVAIIEPLVDEVLDAADELSQGFCEFVQQSDKAKAASTFNMRGAFKRMFKAVNHTITQIQEAGGEIAENLTATVVPTLEKLVRHTEKVFSRLVVLVSVTKETLTKKREEFARMMNVEAHVATLMKVQQQAAIGAAQ